MIRTLIADDEPLLRTGIRTILSTADDITVVGEAGTGSETIDLASEEHPDIVLLDLRMPGIGGLAAIPRLRQVTPDSRVIVLTTFDEDHNITTALDAGATGFLLKRSAAEEVLHAIRAVHQGDTYLSPSVTRRVVGMITTTDRPRQHRARRLIATLTPREQDVLWLLGEGLSNADIGSRLRMREASIKTYVSRLLAKLGCTNRVQAALLVRDAGDVPRRGGETTSQLRD
ncbi:response regulator [Amycolatopsis keratiniphila]|uniref:DNA-binding response regulator n=1 Tax=Amycolatopsis keratiniphila subsp. keratiniphila TaxID=227715 RepID=A0A1W2LZH8_9PSEU|nr:response regulator transcription factor [Amycolatopsis keratiniphila]ONF72643.1 DNA-binding response regulator [Amycolatopsis keratiniphila subsp. keratiniphila]